jgi:hypothetical protein
MTITDRYHGWANWATWNVALWIQNDESLYYAAKECRTYQDLVSMLRDCGSKETPDGCRWDDPAIDGIEINDLMQVLYCPPGPPSLYPLPGYPEQY